MKPVKKRTIGMVKNDPWLEQVRQEILDRYDRYVYRLKELESEYGSLSKMADAYQYFGIHYDRKARGWWYREWAPHAQDLYLFGDFNDWQRYSHRLTRKQNGVWEIFLEEDLYKERFTHKSLVKVLVHSEKGFIERIPAWIQRVVQDPETKNFSGQVWLPPKFNWEQDKFDIGDLSELLIYETHVGMSMEKEDVATFVEFADYLIPYIKNSGYNTIQLMAIAEHPYYGSFGYHVANFFAVSSRFGTPEDLKYLIRRAHEQGIAVIMDIVHSHTVKNINEGLNEFDGSDSQYFHPGERGNHPHWDSKCFNYGKKEVLQFLLSNIKFWLKEFHFDGFRFDGVTSMLYFDHGFRDGWDINGYFRDGVEWDAVTYLQLANKLAHSIYPNVVTIAEEVSGMPGICFPIKDGGFGFDYRLGMAIPDFWIRYLKEKADEEWDIYEMWNVLTDRLPGVKTIAYCESHDQALVGDQTIAFRLMQSNIYFHMHKKDSDLVIDRGLALHKMIRLVTLALGGNSYLNFMGNEFGHPDWIDFPREGNNWSFKYAKRMWSLVENMDLKYHYLREFDVEMIRMTERWQLFHDAYGRQLNMDPANKTIIFERAGLIFIFNFHPHHSIPDYEFEVPGPGKYRIILNSDNKKYGGHERIDEKKAFFTQTKKSSHYLKIYNTNRTAMVLMREE